MSILLNYYTPDLTASFTNQQNNNINMYMIKRRSKLAHPPSSSLHRILLVCDMVTAHIRMSNIIACFTACASNKDMPKKKLSRWSWWWWGLYATKCFHRKKETRFFWLKSKMRFFIEVWLSSVANLGIGPMSFCFASPTFVYMYYVI